MLVASGHKILVDCGLLQGLPEDEEKNFEPFKYDPSEAEFLIVTHAHMDHIGKIPKLVRDGFKGRIISTLATAEIAKVSLLDALNIAIFKNPNHLLYEEKDIEKAFSLWQTHDYGEKINLFENCNLEMTDAGHILGSAIVNISCGQGNEIKKMSFTGDLGNSPSPLLPDTQSVTDADYLVMESVYGDRNHTDKKDRKEKLKMAILNGIKKGGPIIIPAFSIERSQELLYELNNMVEDGELPKISVYMDSPLAEKVTEIYKRHTGDFKKEIQEEIKNGDNIFSFPELEIVETHNESIDIEKVPNPKIIMAGSGMSSGGRVVNHEMHFLSDPKATIIITGYQAASTLGRQLQEGVKDIEIGKNKIRVKAKIESVLGYSSHADSDHLLEFVEKAAESKKLRKVFVIMGEPKSSLFLVQRIRDYIGVNAIYPEQEKEYFL